MFGTFSLAFPEYCGPPQRRRCSPVLSSQLPPCTPIPEPSLFMVILPPLSITSFSLLGSTTSLCSMSFRQPAGIFSYVLPIRFPLAISPPSLFDTRFPSFFVQPTSLALSLSLLWVSLLSQAWIRLLPFRASATYFHAAPSAFPLHSFSSLFSLWLEVLDV